MSLMNFNQNNLKLFLKSEKTKGLREEGKWAQFGHLPQKEHPLYFIGAWFMIKLVGYNFLVQWGREQDKQCVCISSSLLLTRILITWNLIMWSTCVE